MVEYNKDIDYFQLWIEYSIDHRDTLYRIYKQELDCYGISGSTTIKARYELDEFTFLNTRELRALPVERIQDCNRICYHKLLAVGYI